MNINIKQIMFLSIMFLLITSCGSENSKTQTQTPLKKIERKKQSSKAKNAKKINNKRTAYFAFINKSLKLNPKDLNKLRQIENKHNVIANKAKREKKFVGKNKELIINNKAKDLKKLLGSKMNLYRAATKGWKMKKKK